MRVRFGITFAILVIMILIKFHISTMNTATEWYSCELSSDGLMFIATDKGINLYRGLDLWKHIPIPNSRVHYQIFLEEQTIYMLEHNNEYIIDLDTLQFIKIPPRHSFSTIEKERYQLKKNGEYTVQLKHAYGKYWVEYQESNQPTQIISMEMETWLWKVFSHIFTFLLITSCVYTLYYCLKSGEYHYPKLY